MSACGRLQAVHHDLEDVAGMGWAPAWDESHCSQLCSEFGFSTWQCLSTEFEVFLLACLSWQGAQPCLAASPGSPLSAWVWKSPWHFYTSFQHRLEALCSPLIYITYHPKTPRCCHGVVFHGLSESQIPGLENPMWNLMSGGTLEMGCWIPLSTPQMECVGIASPSLCASGATINNNSNQHLHVNALLKAEVNLNSPYHDNSWFFSSPLSCWFTNISVQWSVRSYSQRKNRVLCLLCSWFCVSVDFVWLKDFSFTRGLCTFIKR